jgi:hypothetical protein
MIDPSIVGPTTLAISQAVGSFNSFLPSIADIRKNDPVNNPEFTADVRTGEVAAVAITLGVGVIVSSLTGHPAPAIVALIAALGLVVLYESTLRREYPTEGKTA